MKKLFLLTVVFGWLVACKQPAPTTPEIGRYTIEQFMDNESVMGSGLSPDKTKLLVTSNRSGIFNMYNIDVATGEYTTLTQSDSASVYAISYFPADERILFRMDGNGDEIYKLFVKDGENITRLSPAENVRALFYGWSSDDTGFYYATNQRDPRLMDIYKMDIETFTPTLLFQNDGSYDFGGISHNEKFIALSKSLNTNDSDLFLYELATGEYIPINPEKSGNTAQGFTLDGRYFYYTTDANNEFSYLMKYDLETKSSQKIVEKNWDILGMSFTKNEKYQVLFINEDAANTLEIIETATGKHLELPTFENAFITGIQFSDDETTAILYVGGSHTPTNIYLYQLETKTLTQLTDVLNKAINPDDLVAATVIRYPSFDGLEIPAIYYRPHTASADQPVPALVWVHGGPGGQSRLNFSSMIQYLVNNDYAILAVNNRGSSGYGKTFFQMDDQNHGDKDLKDCIEGKNWLAQQPEIDSEKIGIIGGSYGGFMTMAALTFAPEEFEVGVNIYGVTNWLRTLKNIPPWWESFREALYLEMGNPHTQDSIRLHAISPLFHTQNVTKPLMVLQGATDPRVLQVESDEIVENVRKNGVPVEYLLFEDEGHGFVKKENQIKAYESIVEFLDKYLKKKTVK